ncbi:MAG: hypothetical protein PHP44_09460 [Kiritimatiellae bacterium]|nr:hypothetical protein [Kiritimatiellia bacterium]MDD4736320.1 hypothetical protein [Kiritimatiellia bacterium]
MRNKWCGILAGIGTITLALSATALEVSDELRLRVEKDIKLVEQEGPQMGDLMAGMREAGASYLPELTAPCDATRYQAQERRRMMVGVYLMDLTYAATFYQQQDAAHYGQAIATLLEQLGFPQPDMERDYREALDQIDLPGGEARLQALLEAEQQDTAWQEMLRNGDGAALVVGGLYGMLIEALYLTCETCVLSDYNPTFIRFVSDMRDSFRIFNRVLLDFDDAPEFAELIDRDERITFVTTLVSLLNDIPSLGAEQIRQLRPIIAKARADIVE